MYDIDREVIDIRTKDLIVIQIYRVRK